MILDSLIVDWMERNIKHYIIRHDLMKGTFVLDIYDAPIISGGKIAYTIDIPDPVVINDDLPEFINIVLPHLREEDRR